MSFLGQFKAMTNPEFDGRVWVAAYKTADNVLNEPATTANHDLRVRLARLVANEPSTYADTFVKRAAMNATIAATIQPDGTATCADSDIEFVVAGWWDRATSQLIR